MVFTKALKSCGGCFTCQKGAFFKKPILFDLPNAYIIYLVSKSTFCIWKVQTNGHSIFVTTFAKFFFFFLVRKNLPIITGESVIFFSILTAFYGYKSFIIPSHNSDRQAYCPQPEVKDQEDNSIPYRSGRSNGTETLLIHTAQNTGVFRLISAAPANSGVFRRILVPGRYKMNNFGVLDDHDSPNFSL